MEGDANVSPEIAAVSIPKVLVRLKLWGEASV